VCTLNVLLADAAQVVNGKLYMLGGGWSWIRPGSPFVVCGKIGIPWDRWSDWHKLRLDLVDGDGQPVLVGSEGEEKAVVIEHPPFRPTVPPQVKPGTSLDWPFAIAINGLPLNPGSLYEWRISINGESEDDWRLAFTTTGEALASAA
jgi:hypothetical protein